MSAPTSDLPTLAWAWADDLVSFASSPLSLGRLMALMDRSLTLFARIAVEALWLGWAAASHAGAFTFDYALVPWASYVVRTARENRDTEFALAVMLPVIVSLVAWWFLL